MNATARARAGARQAPSLVLVGLALVIAAVIGGLLHRSASSSAPSISEVQSSDRRVAGAEVDGVITEADGFLPNGVTVFDDKYPGIANLDPDLLQALHEAATDAARDGIALYVNSGWRSREYQDQLYREAVSTYGSEEAAVRWVATADTSAHVSGNAVDIGPSGAAAWLSEHGAQHGLCQIHRNEPWHYELRLEAIDRGCPAMAADRPRPPRMQP